MNNGYGYTGYLYDAEGQRVAKGTLSAWSCNPATNGFTLTQVARPSTPELCPVHRSFFAMGGRGIASGRCNFGDRTASAPQAAACPAQESSLPQTVSYVTNNRITGGANRYDASGNINNEPGYSFL